VTKIGTTIKIVNNLALRCFVSRDMYCIGQYAHSSELYL